MQNLHSLLLVLLLPIGLLGQQNAKTEQHLTGSFSAGNGSSFSMGYQKLYGIGTKKAFKIGYGARFTNANAKHTDYITAPAKLTSGSQSFVALFTENITANLDTLHISKTAVNYLNANIILQYTIKKWSVGFNIDALGLSFGKSQNGVFNAVEDKALHKTTQTAKPTLLNVLLVSDSDIGSLNSEIYTQYQASSKWGVRAGLSFQFWEYTTQQKLTFDNDRYRAKALMPMIGLSYKL
jgi:hypothetical protein